MGRGGEGPQSTVGSGDKRIEKTLSTHGQAANL
jgi:hypothetical protein